MAVLFYCNRLSPKFGIGVPPTSWYVLGCTNFDSFHSALCSQTIPSSLVPLTILSHPHAIYQGMKEMPSDGVHALGEHSAVLTLVRSLWTQKMTACSQEGIEWSTDWETDVSLCTCRLALKQAQVQEFPFGKKTHKVAGRWYNSPSVLTLSPLSGQVYFLHLQSFLSYDKTSKLAIQPHVF